MAGSEMGWEFPLEGAFECAIRVGIGILEGVSGSAAASGFGIESENPPGLGGVDAPDPTGCSFFIWEEWWDGEEIFIPGHRSSLVRDR